MLVLARVYEQELGDFERALDMNRQIAGLDDRNEQALDALEKLYRNKAQFEDLLKIYEKKLEVISGSDADARVALQSKIGLLYEDEIKDDKRAIALHAILAAAGDEPCRARSSIGSRPELEERARS
jgi:tetratricopeptide (TPR) repeat protein